MHDPTNENVWITQPVADVVLENDGLREAVVPVRGRSGLAR